MVGFTSNYFCTANFAVYISLIEFQGIVTAAVFKALVIFKTPGVAPVLVNTAVYKNAAAQAVLRNAANFRVFLFQITAAIAVFIADLPGNAHIICFLFQVCYPHAKAVKLVRKFRCKPVCICSLRHGFSCNLRHFIAGHQPVTAVSAAGVAFDYAFCGEFIYSVISPVPCRYIAERIGRIYACINAQYHNSG